MHAFVGRQRFSGSPVNDGKHLAFFEKQSIQLGI